MVHLIHHTPPQPASPSPSRYPSFDILRPLRRWIDQIQVTNYRFAHLICRLIPCDCVFERDISLFGRTVHIPALCKLNPVYDQLVGLRFRALEYLSEICGEDVIHYIC